MPMYMSKLNVNMALANNATPNIIATTNALSNEPGLTLRRTEMGRCRLLV